jgi:hypothetical protein
MRLIYELIGRLVVEVVRRRYRRELQTAAAVAAGVTVLAIGAYLASRDSSPEE